jgi:hypothetical protein
VTDDTDRYSKPLAMAKLAVLQRLRDQAKKGNRRAMLRAIDQMIEQEAKALRGSSDDDSETDPSAP